LAPRADDFGSGHAVRCVAVLLDRVIARRLDEARPSGARVEFVVALEQRLPAAGAEVLARGLVLLILAGEGALGAALAQHGILLRRQPLAPFGVGEVDLLVGHHDLLSGEYRSATSGPQGRLAARSGPAAERREQPRGRAPGRALASGIGIV